MHDSYKQWHNYMFFRLKCVSKNASVSVCDLDTDDIKTTERDQHHNHIHDDFSALANNVSKYFIPL